MWRESIMLRRITIAVLSSRNMIVFCFRSSRISQQASPKTIPYAGDMLRKIGFAPGLAPEMQFNNSAPLTAYFHKSSGASELFHYHLSTRLYNIW